MTIHRAPGIAIQKDMADAARSLAHRAHQRRERRTDVAADAELAQGLTRITDVPHREAAE